MNRLTSDLPRTAYDNGSNPHYSFKYVINHYICCFFPYHLKQIAQKSLEKQLQLQSPGKAIDKKRITYIGAKSVSFPDSSLYCYKAGKGSSQSFVSGLSFRFAVNGKIFHVHNYQNKYKVPETNLSNYPLECLEIILEKFQLKPYEKEKITILQSNKLCKGNDKYLWIIELVVNLKKYTFQFASKENKLTLISPLEINKNEQKIIKNDFFSKLYDEGSEVSSSNLNQVDEHKALNKLIALLQENPKYKDFSNDEFFYIGVKEVVFPDAGMYCPRPGKIVKTCFTQGFSYRFALDGTQIFHVHSLRGTHFDVPELVAKEI